MDRSTNNASTPAKQDADTSNFYHGTQSGDSAPTAADRPTNRWVSPAFEEFDLCVEITAYVYQWERF